MARKQLSGIVLPTQPNPSPLPGELYLDVTSSDDPSQLIGGSTGMFIPPSFGRAMKQQLANGLQPRVAFVGDSIMDGYFASTLDGNSWRGQVQTALRAKYGHGGSGFMSASRSTPFANDAGIGSGAAGRVTEGSYFNLSGTWTSYASADYGPGHYAIQTTSGSATANFTGSSVDIWTIGGNGSWTYSIDGGAAVAGTVGSYGAVKQTVTGLSNGTHSIIITRTAGTLYFVGIAGHHTTGVQTENFSQYGGQAIYYSNEETGIKNGRYSGGSLYPADLIIYGMGANDCGNNVAVADFSKRIRRYLDDVMDGPGRQGSTDLLFIISHIGNYDPTNKLWQDYVVALEGIASAYGGASLNFWAQGRNSWNYWSTLNYWNGGDAIHPSDNGHTYMANQIKGLLAKAGLL